MKNLSKKRILVDIAGAVATMFGMEAYYYFLHHDANAFKSPLRMCFCFILILLFSKIGDSVLLSHFKKNEAQKESKTNEE
jgi:hypothetical protein